MRADAAGAAAIARDLLKEALDARAHAPAKDKEKLTLALELATQVVRAPTAAPSQSRFAAEALTAAAALCCSGRYCSTCTGTASVSACSGTTL